MHINRILEPCPGARLFVLPTANSDNEARVALVMPGRLPIVYPTLTDAVAALPQGVGR